MEWTTPTRKLGSPNCIPALLATVALFSLLPPASGQGGFTPGSVKVVLSGEPNRLDPGNAIPTFLNPPLLNNTGLATFTIGTQGIAQGNAGGILSGLWVDLHSQQLFDVRPDNGFAFVWFDNGSLYLATKQGVAPIALKDTAPTAGGTFTGFEVPSANTAGQVFFRATSTGGRNDGVYVGKAKSNPVPIALKGDASGDGGTFTEFGSALINEAGQYAFYAATDGTATKGIFFKSTGPIQRLPTGALASDLFMLNDAGQVAFFAGSTHLWLGTVAGGTMIVKNGDPVPSGGTFGYFNDTIFGPFHPPALSNTGLVAFRADNDGGAGGGIYRWSPQGIVAIAEYGPAPGGSTYIDFEDPAINDFGQVAFKARIDVPTGVDERLYVGDGTGAPVKIIGIGDQVIGTDGVTQFTVTAVDLVEFFGRSLTPGRSALNDKGQVAYRASFKQVGANATFTGIFVYTPLVAPVLSGPFADGGVVKQPYRFQIRAANAPTTFTANVAGSTKLPKGLKVNKTSGLIDGTPAEPGIFTIELSAANAGGIAKDTLTLTVIDLSAYQGRYLGLLQTAPAANATAGTLDLKLTPGAIGTGTLWLGGRKFTVRVSFDGNGHAVVPLPDGGLSLDLQIDRANGTERITGSVLQNGLPYAALSLDRMPIIAAKQASPRQGTYHIILPADPAQAGAPTYPKGTGYGTITVAKSGSLRLAGVLGDAVPFSAAVPAPIVNFVSKTFEFPLYVPLYPVAKVPQGSISGVLTINDSKDANATNHVAGTLAWFLPTLSGKTVVEGSIYAAPTKAAPNILSAPNGQADFTVSGGDITTNPATKLLSINGAKIAIVGGEKFKFTTSSAKGKFTGDFRDTMDTKRTFNGVFLQKQNRAEGLFKGLNGQTGAVKLVPQ